MNYVAIIDTKIYKEETQHISRSRLESALKLQPDALRSITRKPHRWHVMRNYDVVQGLKNILNTDRFIAWEGETK